MSIYTPPGPLSPDQKQLLAEIARKQLAEHHAKARELAALLADLEPLGRQVCACPCGAAGHAI